MNCQRRILGIRWFHFVTNASGTSQTGEEGLTIRICRRRLSIFGHVRRLPEATLAHSALRLAVDARIGGKPDIRPEWKRQRGRPCRTWVQQIEDDTGLNRSTPTTPGGSHMTASPGGRYDPWPVKRSTDWLTDCSHEASLLRCVCWVVVTKRIRFQRLSEAVAAVIRVVETVR